jgi:hypothetical protein
MDMNDRAGRVAWTIALAACVSGLAFPAAGKPPRPPAGQAVTLTTQPGSRLEHDAATLMAEDLAAAKAAHEQPVMLVGSARLGGRSAPAALFVQVQSATLCGSAGCSTSVFVRGAGSAHGWKRVLDSVSGPIKVAAGMHHGMHDLLVHGTDRWIWSGSAYADTLPAPGVNLK